MNKKYLKTCTALLSIAIITSMTPVAAFATEKGETQESQKIETKQPKENGGEVERPDATPVENAETKTLTMQGETVKTKMATASADNNMQYETFKEAFPNDKFRHYLANLLKTVEDSRLEKENLEGEESIILDDDTLLDEDVIAKMKKITQITFGTQGNDYYDLGPKELESIGKYFTGLNNIRFICIKINANRSQTKNMFASLKNVKRILLSTLIVEDNSGFEISGMDELEQLDIFAGDYSGAVCVNNLPNLKSVGTYFTRAPEVSIVDNKNLNQAIFRDTQVENIYIDKNPALNSFTVDYNTSAYIDLTNCPKLNQTNTYLSSNYKFFTHNGNGIINLDNQKGFDSSKVFNLENAKLSGKKLVVENKNQCVKYDYHCNDNVVGSFNILPVNVKSMKIEKGTVPTEKQVIDRILNKEIFFMPSKIFMENENLSNANTKKYDINELVYKVKNIPQSNVPVGTKGNITVDVGRITNDSFDIITEVKVPYTIVGDVEEGWVKNGGYWYYYYENGKMASKTWKKIDGKWYYFYEDGKMASKTWEKIGGEWYYFYAGGTMAANTMVGNYYVNKSGAWRADKWVKTSAGKYWYYYKEGNYPKNEVANINGNKYHFDKGGYMTTGWLKENGTWYYFNKKGEGTEGAMAYNQWKKVNGKWYYFYNDGKMASKTWEKIGGNWYYFYAGGSMASDTMVGSYYVNKSGAWRTDKWVKTSSGGYWYYYKEGGYPKNVITKINGNSYHFNNSGWMTTGWYYEKSTWYYFNKKGEGVEGAMVKSGWKKVSGKWYYFYASGKMAKNTTINGWRVNNSGAWVK